MAGVRELRLLGVNVYAALAVAVLVVALFAVPPAYGQFLPQRISDYLIFGLPALAVGLIAGHARLLNVGVGYRLTRYEVRLDGRNLGDRRDPVSESELGDAQYYRMPAGHHLGLLRPAPAVHRPDGG